MLNRHRFLQIAAAYSLIPGTQFTNIFAKPEDEILESTEAPLSDEQVQSPEQTNAALLEGGKNA